jgi:hypothetical protein
MFKLVAIEDVQHAGEGRGAVKGDHRSRSGWLAFGGMTMAPAVGCFSSPTALCREPSPGIRPSNRNGRNPFPLASAGVCDCPDLVSCAVAVVAASATTNTIASLDMTGFSSRGPANRRGESGHQDGGHLRLRPVPPAR